MGLKNMSQTDMESYPPLFRQRGSSDQGVDFHEHDQKIPDTDDPLPVIDFQCINHDKLDGACRDLGMFRLINHGIPVTLLDKLHDHSKKLLSITFESKQALFTSPIAYFWGTPGLTPSGVAIERGSSRTQNFNWLEGFHVPLSGSLSQCQFEDPRLESFRALLEEYTSHQIRLGTAIFEAMTLNLKLDSRHTKSYLSPATAHLRVHRYPRCFEAEQAWGIDVHTDSSVLSILHQDHVGGLQLLNKDDIWFDIKPDSNTLIMNLGDMMQAMSDDKYIAAKHRVKVHKHKERISIGCFMFPYEDAVIQSSKYKPFTYPDFRAEVQKDLRAVGHKIGLQKFKLHKTF